MVFLKYTIKCLVSRSFSFFLHRNQILTSTSLHLLPAAAWSVLILAVHVGKQLHSWNQIFFNLSTLAKNRLFFLGVKFLGICLGVKLPGHGDPFQSFLFWLAILHLDRCVYRSLSLSVCSTSRSEPRG